MTGGTLGDGRERLRIYHTSDLHDHRGIVPGLRELRAAEPGLLFDCGDSLRGSQTVYYRNEPIVAEIDAAGYDAQGIGNREFHYLFPLLAARASRMDHPLLCTNLVDVRTRPLPFASETTFDYGSWRVRVFALLVVQYPDGSPWERLFGWRFLDPFETARRVAETTPDGTTLVVLSHLGLRADRRLAQAVPRLDLILGGHSHDTLHEPECEFGVPIVHAGPYGAYVSRTELESDGAGRARIARFDLVPLLEPPG
jgi:2',3'-cyclic-nucleotide 2'-phosphodiesterase (5'-nucleotidase family)